MVKSHLKKQAKEILNSEPVGFVFSKNNVHFNFLMRIFQGHPEYSIKLGSGINTVSIGIGGEFKTRCFVLNRIDGTFTDISYLRSIDGATTKISDIKCACRSAIDHIVITYRRGVVFGVDKCPISDEILTVENTHIDHFDLTFDEVFTKWITRYNIDQLATHLNDTSVDNVHKIYFTSQIIINDFVSFHNANTHLRAVTKSANLSTLKRKK